jgi:hypothetical protein
LKIERELNKIDELFDLDETGCENEDKTEWFRVSLCKL